MARANDLVERTKGRMTVVYEADRKVFCYRSHPLDDWPPSMETIVTPPFSTPMRKLLRMIIPLTLKILAKGYEPTELRTRGF